LSSFVLVVIRVCTWKAQEIKRAEEFLLKHEDDKLVLIVLLFWLRISTFIEFSPLR
jgi:hypothetical protein